MTTAWVPLATVTLSATDSSVTFGSIDSSSYTNYQMIIDGLAVAPYVVYSLRMNGNTNGVYGASQMAALSNDGQGAGNFLDETGIGIHATGIEGGKRGMSVITFYDAGRSTATTSIIAQGFGFQDGNSMYVREQWSGSYNVVEAVNLVEVRLLGGGLAAGSTIHLYGMKGI